MGERLYNNIELPNIWPPEYQIEELKNGMPIPYLQNPPEVIDISCGRQLFVDDFLIESTDLITVYHKAKKYHGNPVLYPETPMEMDEALPGAAPKDGGVWFDNNDKKYKMWYEAGWLHKMAYAESDDGVHWERPMLDIVEGTNEILAGRGQNDPEGNGESVTFRPDSTSVVIDYEANPDERYKLFLRNPGLSRPAIVGVSSDGINFNKCRYTDKVDDRSTMFYNPFRKKWVFSIRNSVGDDRVRDYYECDDIIEEAKFGDKKVRWLCTDNAMKPNPYIGDKPQLYNFNAIAYESIMLGLFEVHYGPNNVTCYNTGVPKITELIPVYSRDGFHFSKPSDDAVINAEMNKGAWDRGYVQSVGGGCIVYRDEIRIYYSGFAGDESKAGTGNPDDCGFHSNYSNFATGFATLRRDGFVSLKANGKRYLKTRPLTFKGSKNNLFINAETYDNGYVKVAVVDERGNDTAMSRPFMGNGTCEKIILDGYDLSTLEDKTFTLRFEAENAEIYSFWFSDSDDGASGGYDGAGSPDKE